MVKKLRCDRCGYELTDIEEIDIALDGMEAWHISAGARGIKARGILPCKHYVRCGGEIVEVVWWRDWSKKLFRNQE